jgi:hypothetical protein
MILASHHEGVSEGFWHKPDSYQAKVHYERKADLKHVCSKEASPLISGLTAIIF